MTNIEGRTCSYHYHLRTAEPVKMKPKPRDTLRFDVTVTIRRCRNHLWHGDVIGASTILETSIPISCESFFENYQDLLSSCLSDPRCSSYFIPESIDQTSQAVIFMVQRLVEFPSEPDSADSESREFALTLAIIVDVLEDGEGSEEDGEVEQAIIEESMQQGISMIPASDEAIHSLKSFSDSSFLEIEECNICMENFHAEENEGIKLSYSSMPCGHVFHRQCIVEWLEISHTCPLCRYPMPTVKD